MLVIALVLVFGLVSECHGQTKETLSCLSCSRLTNPEDCNEKIQCLQGEVCMTERYITEQGHVFYDLGCKLASICSSVGFTVSKAELDARIKNHLPGHGKGQGQGNIVGRKREDPFESGVVHTCQECCETEHCNNYLCGGHVSTNLKCVSCKAVASMSYCDKLETCRPHEVCFIQEVITDRFELEYNGGCMRSLQCQAFWADIDMSSRGLCFNCCNDSFCNNYCYDSSTPRVQSFTIPTTTATTEIKATTSISKTESSTATAMATPSSTVAIPTLNIETTATEEITSTYKTTSASIIPTVPTTTTSKTASSTTSKIASSTTPFKSTTDSTTKPQITSTTETVETVTKTTTATASTPVATTSVTTICPTFPLPTFKEPIKVNNTFANLGCGKKEDIMFLVDNAAILKDKGEYFFEVFSQALIESMKLGPEAAKVGYSYFSGFLLHVVDLNLGESHEYVDKKLKNLESHRGPGRNNTDLADALAAIYSSLTGSRGRHDASKTIVLMVEQYNTNRTFLHSIAKELQGNNVTVIVVAVGHFSQEAMKELKDLASVPTESYLYSFNQSYQLRYILEDIVLSRCKEHQMEVSLPHDPCSGPKLLNNLGCGDEEDIVMLLDRSGSISSNDWKQIHKFVHEMVAKFNIAPDASRLGLMTFNDNVTELVQLQEFLNKTDVLTRIDTLLDSKDQQPMGGRMTGDALEKSIEWFKNSNRTKAAKTVVLFTDGGSDTKFATVARSLELHRMNVSVFVIGIGHDVDLKEQLIIASDPDNEHMINVKDVDGLLQYLTYLEAVRCRETAIHSTLNTTSPSVASTFAALPVIG